MTTLCTFPGKFGDLIWSLPTIRALSRRLGEPVDLLTSLDMASIAPLVSQQPYIGKVRVQEDWVRTDVDPNQKRLPPIISRDDYDRMIHLGYRDWPQRPLPFETLDCLHSQWGCVERGREITDQELRLDEPWITTGWEHGFAWRPLDDLAEIAVGFTDEHFELKFGLTELLDQRDDWILTHIGNAARWENEVGERGMTWAESLTILRNVDIFLGCCSALHVLAVAAGVPVILMEPSEARWNPIFYPLGTVGPQVTLVLGTDGRPTFDARHVCDALDSILARRSPHARHRETQGS